MRIDLKYSIICLIFIFSNGCKEAEPILPEADFFFLVDGQKVSFFDRSVNANTIFWEFGDGNTSTENSPVYTYQSFGSFQVILNVENRDGVGSLTRTINVAEPEVANFVMNKNWLPVRENAVAYHYGPDDESWNYNPEVAAPWYCVGDLIDFNGNFQCDYSLSRRASMANDIYNFGPSNQYTIDWNGDFWGEYGIWLGTDFNEQNINIENGSLPKTANDIDVSSFINTSQQYNIDEIAKTLTVYGEGAHIINPRLQNSESSLFPGHEIEYEIFHTAEGDIADTLILKHNCFDNEFDVAGSSYFTLASYKMSIPALRDTNGAFVPRDLEDEVSSKDFFEVFDMEGNVGPAVDEVSYFTPVEYGVEIEGELCAKYTRTDVQNGFTDYKIWSRDADIRFDVDGEYQCAIAQIDVYVPSSNDFSGNLINALGIALGDESEDDDTTEGGPGMWCCWAFIEKLDMPLDEWVTLSFDFRDLLIDGSAPNGIRDDIDVIVIRPGGTGHDESGVFYLKDFKFVSE